MHITPMDRWDNRCNTGSGENLLPANFLAPIANGRVERLKLLCRIIGPKDRRKIITVKNVEACKQEKEGNKLHVDPNRDNRETCTG